MPKDIIIGTSGAPEIAGGDFVVAESTEQHGSLLLQAHPGEWRQWPVMGVGLTGFLLDDGGEAELRHRVEVMAQYDGALVESLTIDGDDVNLSIYYPDGT